MRIQEDFEQKNCYLSENLLYLHSKNLQLKIVSQKIYLKIIKKYFKKNQTNMCNFFVNKQLMEEIKCDK